MNLVVGKSISRLSAFLAIIVALASHSAATSRMYAQAITGSKLTVRVTGVRNNKGMIAFALFRSAEGFPGDASKAFRKMQAAIDPQTHTAQVSFDNLPRGVYAVAIFHDENSNGRLDKNMLGIPKEGYGASNNPKKEMGPPKFAEARFDLNQPEQTIEIKPIY